MASAQDWRPAGKVLPADGQSLHYAGTSVAAGDHWLFVGTPGDDLGKANNGSVRLYAFDGLAWSPLQTIVPTEVAPLQFFGNAMALDGETLVVGAPGRDVFADLSGAAFVFELGNDGWKESALLVPDIGGLNDYFGSTVAIEGDVIAIGCLSFEDPVPNPGFVCIFERVFGIWTLSATVDEDPTFESSFGQSVAIENGNVFVGSSSGGQAGKGGSVSIIRKLQGQWVRTTRLTPGNDEKHNNFGNDIAASDGRLFVSAYGEPDGSFAGSVYVFENAGGNWSLTARLTAPNAKPQNLFGVSIDAFGDTLAVGGRQYRCGWESTVHVFEREGGQWGPAQVLVPWDPADNGTWGPSVAVSSTILIAGDSRDDAQGFESGSAFAFSRTAPLPCPGDLNHDGQTDFFDFLMFLNLRRLGHCDADLNGDDRIDIFDWLAMQNAFAADCPE